MKKKVVSSLVAGTLLAASLAWGLDLSSNVIKWAAEADRAASWYATDWAVNSRYSPEFEVLDTESAEKKVREGKASPAEITQTRDLAWDFSRELLSRPLADSFAAEELAGFQYPESGYTRVGKRGDIQHKNDPY